LALERSELGRRLDRLPTEPPALGSAGAAVLLILRSGPAGPETLLIQRSDRPEDPGAGQVSLPGGRRDGSDRSLRETALRELREEVGLSVEDLEPPVRYLGTFSAPHFGLEVAAFVAPSSPTASEPRPADPTEVQEVFWLPLRTLQRTERVPRSTSRGEREVDAVRFQGHVLWGFTRRLLLEFDDRLGRGFPAPGDGSGSGGPPGSSI
jgi:8-oxo-dGTP pyrophosphatase MutT (NUDIX family)